jgi:hypothetical protein
LFYSLLLCHFHLYLFINVEIPFTKDNKNDWKQDTTDKRCTTKAQTNDENNERFSPSNIDEQELESVAA